MREKSLKNYMIGAIKQSKKIYMINQFLHEEEKDKLTRKEEITKEYKKFPRPDEHESPNWKRSITHLSMLLLNCRIAGAKKKIIPRISKKEKIRNSLLTTL